MGNSDTDGPLHPGPRPGAADDGDMEWAEYVAWLDREAAAGRDPEPGPWASGDAEPWDPEPGETDVAAPWFAADGDADAQPPGPGLAALTEQAVSDVSRLSDDELVGVLRATQRQMAREQYKQMLAAAEFGRPAAVKARRDQARRDNQRVDVRREASGNASLAGRELDVADVLASKAYLDAVASRLRASGLDGSLDRLRALALTDLTRGRDPLHRIQPTADQAAPAGPPPVPRSS